jgi:hypothetical protein
MKRLLVSAAAILALGALAIWWFSPERVLKRRIAGFIDTANVPGSMSDLARGARGNHLADYFADRITVDSPDDLDDEVGQEFTRDEAAATYSMVASYCREISITRLAFTGIAIEGDAALVHFTADAIVELPQRRPVDGLITVESHWRKTDGGWLLESFQWTESPRTKP